MAARAPTDRRSSRREMSVAAAGAMQLVGRSAGVRSVRRRAMPMSIAACCEHRRPRARAASRRWSARASQRNSPSREGAARRWRDAPHSASDQHYRRPESRGSEAVVQLAQIGRARQYIVARLVGIGAQSIAGAGLRPLLTAAARDGRLFAERDGGMSWLFREQRNGNEVAHSGRMRSACCGQQRHRSAPALASGWTRPEQMESGAVAAGLEQVGAERLCEGGIVDLQ